MKTGGPFAMSLERWYEVTEKQKVFADEYLIDLNATRAYKVAYPAVKKDEVAAVNGNRMLRNAKVAEYIAERMQDRQKRTEITQDKVLQELAAVAFSNATDYVEVRDNTVIVKDTASLSDTQIKALSGIKESRGGIEVKLNDKLKALELLGRHLGMFKDKVEVSGIDEEKKKLDDILRQMRGDG